MSARALVAAWISQQCERPPKAAIAKQGAAAKRLARDYDRDTLTRALAGIARLFPHSEGEPWDLFDLERKFVKALAAPTNRGGMGRAPREIDYHDLAGWTNT